MLRLERVKQEDKSVLKGQTDENCILMAEYINSGGYSLVCRISLKFLTIFRIVLIARASSLHISLHRQKIFADF